MYSIYSKVDSLFIKMLKQLNVTPTPIYIYILNQSIADDCINPSTQ